VFEPWRALFERLRGEYAVTAMREYPTWLAKWSEGKQKSITLSRLRDQCMAGKLKAMIKRECYHRLPKKARLIQYYANLCTQSEFGPEFYALQKVLCKELQQLDMGDGIDVTFASGMNAAQITAWMATVSPWTVAYLERDGANWDSSLGEMCANFRCRLYAVIDERLAQFARDGNCVSAYGVLPDGIVRYLMEYGVKSGHNDTTLGNSIVNAAIAMAVMKQLGLRGSIIVAGDDLLIAVRSDFDLAAYIAAERAYGIVPEAGKFYSHKHVTFCSGIFLGDSCAYLPTPGRLLKRLWWTTKPPHQTTAYLRGVARGLWPSCHDVPIVRVLLSKFDSAGAAGQTDKGFQYIGVEHDLGDAALAAFAERYDVPVSDVVACEAWLRTLPAEPLILVHPLLERISIVDETDITERAALWPGSGPPLTSED
jgi:hypothetical protein